MGEELEVGRESGFDPSRVFGEMDRYLEAAQAEGWRPVYFRVAESLIRELSPGTSRIVSYQGVPVLEADEWSWGWMLKVCRGRFGGIRTWFQP